MSYRDIIDRFLPHIVRVKYILTLYYFFSTAPMSFILSKAHIRSVTVYKTSLSGRVQFVSSARKAGMALVGVSTIAGIAALGCIATSAIVVAERLILTQVLNSMSGMGCGAAGRIVDDVFWHHFIVFETEDGFFSMSKGNDGIAICNVDKNHKQELLEINKSDGNPEDIKTSPVDINLTINEVMEWFDATRQEEIKYHLILRNCKDFCSTIYNRFAQDVQAVDNSATTE